MSKTYNIPEFADIKPQIAFDTCYFLEIIKAKTAKALCAIPENKVSAETLQDISPSSRAVCLSLLKHPITVLLEQYNLMPDITMSEETLDDLNEKILQLPQQNNGKKISGGGYIVEKFSTLLNIPLSNYPTILQCQNIIETTNKYRFLLIAIDEMPAESLFVLSSLCGKATIPIELRDSSTDPLEFVSSAAKELLTKHLMPSILIYDAMKKSLTEQFNALFAKYPTLNLTFIKYKREQLSQGKQTGKEFATKKILKKDNNSPKFSIPEFADIKPVLKQHTQVFIHIPKTGGHSVLDIYSKQLEPENIFHPLGGGFSTGKEEFLKLSVKEMEKIRYISGHNNFGIHTQLPQSCCYFTVLRDPVECFISTYYFCWQIAIKRNYITKQLEFNSLNEWTDYNLKSNIKHGYISETLLQYDKCWLADKTHTVNADELQTEEVYHLIKQNIANFFCVGITEMFEETVFMLAWYNGWHEVPFLRHINQTQHRPAKKEVSPLLLKKIENVQGVSMQLYAECKTEFENKFKKLCQLFPGLQDSLQRYKHEVKKQSNI